MLATLALLALLVRPLAATEPGVCELPRAFPGTTTSRSCVGCHDGSIGPASHVAFPTALEGLASIGQQAGVHPIEVDYEQSALRHPGTLAPRGALAPELALSAGQVTCVTCHSPGSREPHKVSLPMNGSALCLACHLY